VGHTRKNIIIIILCKFGRIGYLENYFVTLYLNWIGVECDYGINFFKKGKRMLMHGGLK